MNDGYKLNLYLTSKLPIKEYPSRKKDNMDPLFCTKQLHNYAQNTFIFILKKYKICKFDSSEITQLNFFFRTSIVFFIFISIICYQFCCCNKETRSPGNERKEVGPFCKFQVTFYMSLCTKIFLFHNSMTFCFGRIYYIYSTSFS